MQENMKRLQGEEATGNFCGGVNRIGQFEPGTHGRNRNFLPPTHGLRGSGKVWGCFALQGNH